VVERSEHHRRIETPKYRIPATMPAAAAMWRGNRRNRWPPFQSLHPRIPPGCGSDCAADTGGGAALTAG